MKNELMISLRANRTQKEIAEQLGISRTMYNAIENGKRTPSIKVMKKLTKFYGLTFETLFFSNQ